MKTLMCLGTVALATALSAQSVVVPAGMANTNTGQSGLAWRNTLFHFQMVYDTSHFLTQGINRPISINRLRFRATGGVTSLGGDTYTGVTIKMSSSPLDWNSASTAFLSNQGTDVVTVFTGNITATAATGTSPNDYIIDIPLSTPFVYDPTEGLDLNIDVNSPSAPIPATMPNMATSSVAAEKARRISTATANATTGALSSFAAVALLDYTLVPNAATATSYGNGCDARAVSFYENYAPGAFDMSGTPGSPNSIKLSNLAGGYIVTAGSNNWFTPTSTALVLTDDSLSAILPLPWTFNYPNGSTTGIKVCSNGFVWLDTTQTGTSAAGSSALLLAQGARLAPLWNDLDPSVGGAVYFDVDPNNQAVYATWDNVPLFGIPTSFCTLQLAMFANGDVEYRWQACTNATGLVGWTPGANPRDGGNTDISASIPFLTRPDMYPLTITAPNRPKLGNTQQLSIDYLPAGATIAAMSIGFTPVVPGIPLQPIGMIGCFQNASIDISVPFAVTGTSQSFPLGIPNDPNLAGLHLYLQSVSTAPGVNVTGIVTSNGMDLAMNVN